MITAEDGAGLSFLSSLKARGLSGVRLAISTITPGWSDARLGARGLVIKVSDPLREKPPDQGGALASADGGDLGGSHGDAQLLHEDPT